MKSNLKNGKPQLFLIKIMTKSKRGERGSSSSSVSSHTKLKKAKLQEELCSLRQEMKEEVDTLESNMKSVVKSVDEIWATIEDMKEATKALKDSKPVQEDEM